MTKREPLIQYVTISISIITVILTGFTAYNGVQISGKITKQNEVESRNYSTKKDIYFQAFQLMQELEKVDNTTEVLFILGIKKNNTGSLDFYQKAKDYKELSSNIELVGSKKLDLLWKKLDFYLITRTLKVIQEKGNNYTFSHYKSGTLLETEEGLYFKDRPLGIILLIKEQIKLELYNPANELQFENIDYPIPFITGKDQDNETLDDYNKRIDYENKKRLNLLKQIYSSDSIFP